MDKLIEAIGPVLISSIALQQLIELLDPVLDAWVHNHKQWILRACYELTGHETSRRRNA